MSKSTDKIARPHSFRAATRMYVIAGVVSFPLLALQCWTFVFHWDVALQSFPAVMILCGALFLFVHSHRIVVDQEGITVQEPFRGSKRIHWKKIKRAKRYRGVGPRGVELDGPLSLIEIETFDGQHAHINSRIYDQKNLEALLDAISREGGAAVPIE